ncbi:MAG: helix-turn-helix domain-containing protein [Turicibacter sp.]|nr:helix-turn-helix domain-containing protein [Turicibacter sp.]
MNISKIIKEQRSLVNLSQEELAEKVYVSRQTISSWENGKTYPDVHSLVLLANAFEITIDELVKGDVKEMAEIIEKSDISEMKRYSCLMTIGVVLTIVGIPISFYLASIIGLVVCAMLFAVSLYFGYRIEKIKCQYDVQTYREIVAFTKGETLDEITKIRESGKRTYQKMLLIAASAAFGFILSRLIAWILPAIRGPWGG